MIMVREDIYTCGRSAIWRRYGGDHEYNNNNDNKNDNNDDNNDDNNNDEELGEGRSGG